MGLVFDANNLCRILFEDIGLPSDTEFAVAYSGGCDSQVLLHAMSVIRQKTDISLTALHFDHGLAPQSAEWAHRCEAVCREWDIAFIGHRQPLVKPSGCSLEAHARDNRYQWFAEVVTQGQVLLTAHHANDQAETVLLNLVRGGGVELLVGIPQLRFLSKQKDTRVVRPLLSFPQSSLADYAACHKLTWSEDPSNQCEQFDRNYLRKSLIPMLQKRWPGVISTLADSAQQCRMTVAFLDEITLPLLQQCYAPEKRGVFCLAPPLATKVLKPLGQFQCIRLIRRWLHQHGCRSPSSGQLATLSTQVFAPGSESAEVHWAEFALRYFHGYLYLTRQLDDCAGTKIEWDIRTCELGKNELRIEVLPTNHSHNPDHKESAAVLNQIDSQRLSGKVSQLIWRMGGERITLPGRKHSSALKKLFQHNAVPPWERDAVPLLVVDGEVAWAHGVGASAKYCGAQHQPSISLRFVVG